MKSILLAGIASSLATVQYANRVSDGRGVFLQNCQACHGAAATGSRFAPDLHPIARQLAAPDEHEGTEERIRMRLASGGDRMPAFPHIPEADVASLLAYLEKLAAEEPAAVSPAAAEAESWSCPHEVDGEEDAAPECGRRRGERPCGGGHGCGGAACEHSDG